MTITSRHLFILCLLIITVVGAWATVHSESQDPFKKPDSEQERLFRDLMIERPGNRPEPFEGTVWDLSGNKSGITPHRGKITLVTFWATWCPPCREEMPSLQNLYSSYKDKGLAVLAVNLEESHTQVTDYFHRHGLTFKPLLDPSGEFGRSLRLRAIPSTFILDGKGMAIGFALGPRPWDSPEARALVELLLDIE